MSRLTSSFEKNYKQEDAGFITDIRLNNIEILESKFNMSIEETKSFDYSEPDGKTLRIFSQNAKVNIPALIEGKALSNGDIMIDPSYAKANKLKTGDSIKVYNRNFTISGFMSLPNYIYPLKSESDIMNDPHYFGIAVIGKNEFNRFGKGNISYAIRFNGDRSNIDDKLSRFKDYLRNENVLILSWMNITDNPRVNYVTAKIAGIDKMSFSMPVAILILTCILTGMVMWRMLKREFVIIGTLYALGYKKRNIMNHYLLFPLIISLLGGITGTALEMLTVRPMISYYLSYFNMPLGSITFSIKYEVISLLLPVIFLIICGR